MRALPLLLLLPIAAQAQDLSETHFARNFCWERSYGAAHLNEHPEQKVRWIALARGPLGQAQTLGRVSVEVRVMMTDTDEEYIRQAECRPKGEGLDCWMEGDAGGFALEAEGSEIRLTVGPEGMTFEGWHDTRSLSPDEGDDREFLVRRCG